MDAVMIVTLMQVTALNKTLLKIPYAINQSFIKYTGLAS